jgi:hypothetical protein
MDIKNGKHIYIFLIVSTIFLIGIIGRLLANPDIGLILRYIDKIDGKPVVANIFDTKSRKSFEYTVGDYVNGLLIKQIFDDRVIILDEITKFQYVLTVNRAEYEEPEEVGVTRYRRRRRSIDGMDITAEFNRELAKAEGTYRYYGTSSKKDELEKEGEIINEMKPLMGNKFKNNGLEDREYNPNNVKNPFSSGSGTRSGKGSNTLPQNNMIKQNPFGK